jgi:hypothetical protein
MNKIEQALEDVLRPSRERLLDQIYRSVCQHGTAIMLMTGDHAAVLNPSDFWAQTGSDTKTEKRS